MVSKWYGKIGFATTVEAQPGVWVEDITERPYYGDILRNTRRLQSSSSVNDNVTINNEFSIVADPFANQNFYAMRYIEFMGTRWKINSVEVKYPRLILSIGGVYNGEQARSAE